MAKKEQAAEVAADPNAAFKALLDKLVGNQTISADVAAVIKRELG